MAKQTKRNKQIVDLRDKGWTLQKIADKFGISVPRVWQICRNTF